MYYVRRDTASVDTHQSRSRMVMHQMVQYDTSSYWPAEAQHSAGLFLIDYIEKPFVE